MWLITTWWILYQSNKCELCRHVQISQIFVCENYMKLSAICSLLFSLMILNFSLLLYVEIFQLNYVYYVFVLSYTLILKTASCTPSDFENNVLCVCACVTIHF